MRYDELFNVRSQIDRKPIWSAARRKKTKTKKLKTVVQKNWFK